jgi:hypothetical protein
MLETELYAVAGVAEFFPTPTLDKMTRNLTATEVDKLIAAGFLVVLFEYADSLILGIVFWWYPSYSIQTAQESYRARIGLRRERGVARSLKAYERSYFSMLPMHNSHGLPMTHL